MVLLIVFSWFLFYYQWLNISNCEIVDGKSWTNEHAVLI